MSLGPGFTPTLFSLGAVGALLLTYSGLFQRVNGRRRAADAAQAALFSELTRRDAAVEAALSSGEVPPAVAATARLALAEGAAARARGDVAGAATADRRLSESSAATALSSVLEPPGLAPARAAFGAAIAAYNAAVTRLPTRVIASWARLTPRAAWEPPAA